MGDPFAPTCQLLSPPAAGVVGSLVAALLVALVLAVVAPGLGPLRAWLGRGSMHGSPASDVASGDGGLLDTWRLYRQLGRDATGIDFSGLDIRASIVPTGPYRVS